MLDASLQDEKVEQEVIVLDWWDDLNQVNLKEQTSTRVSRALAAAFGPEGIGVVAIRNVPGFVEAKQRFLPMAHTLATLPSDYLEQNLTDPATLYNAGWSHGKEKMGDKPDCSKGSFYYNPVTDLAGTLETRERYPLSYPKNIWPDETVLAGFRAAACRMGCILKEATVELAKHIDVFAKSRQPQYPDGFLYNVMKDTDKVKARLLYYYPLHEESAQDDSWIGWHNDSGFLTALAGDLYVNHVTGLIVECPDPTAGLYVATKTAGMIRIVIPADCMAVQIGECTQIVTGGAVCATPHCVRGVSGDVARISLPCFIDTPPTFPLSVPPGCTRDEVLDAATPHGRVPPLEYRWKTDGMTFGDFLHHTFSMYYEWNRKES